MDVVVDEKVAKPMWSTLEQLREWSAQRGREAQAWAGQQVVATERELAKRLLPYVRAASTILDDVDRYVTRRAGLGGRPELTGVPRAIVDVARGLLARAEFEPRVPAQPVASESE